MSRYARGDHETGIDLIEAKEAKARKEGVTEDYSISNLESKVDFDMLPLSFDFRICC